MKLPPNHVPGVGVVQSTAWGGIGQKLLEKMGWSAGEGLGKRRDGRREAIRVQTKHNTQGLGLKKKDDWDVESWKEIYENSLQKLSQVVNASDTDSSSSEEDAEERTERRTNPDGTVSTAAHRELQIYAYLSKPQQRQMGRWSSRSAKLERIRKQEQQQKQEPPPDRTKKRKKFKKSTDRTEAVSNKRVKE